MNMLSISPAFVLIPVLAIIYAALFHLWRGHGWSDLAVSLLAAGLGLAAGQLLGGLFQFDLLRIGQVYLLEGTALAWALMLAAAWLKG